MLGMVQWEFQFDYVAELDDLKSLYILVYSYNPAADCM